MNKIILHTVCFLFKDAGNVMTNLSYRNVQMTVERHVLSLYDKEDSLYSDVYYANIRAGAKHWGVRSHTISGMLTFNTNTHKSRNSE